MAKSPPPTTTPKPKVGQYLQGQYPRDPSSCIFEHFRCCVDVAASEKTDDLVADVIAIQQYEDDEDQDDADRQ